MNLSGSDFEIFDLPVQFALDQEALSAAYLRLQAQTHPDRFANGSAQEKRLAMQWTTRINEAYKRLQNPMERALYWCELQGLNAREHQSHVPKELLIQQMDWRDELDEIDSPAALEEFIDAVAAEKRRCLKVIADQIDIDKDAKAANVTAQALLFIDKFLIELNKKLEKMEDAS